MKEFYIFLSCLIGLYRPVLLFKTPNKHVLESYKAFAHLLVGGLVVAGAIYENVDEVHKVIGAIFLSAFAPEASWQMRTASVLTWVEIICAGVGIWLKRTSSLE